MRSILIKVPSPISLSLYQGIWGSQRNIFFLMSINIYSVFAPSKNLLNPCCFNNLVVVQLLSCVRLFATPWIAAHQPLLSFTISWSLLKLMSIESVMPSHHLILCYTLLLLPSIFPRIRVFSSESVLCIRWPKYWHFSFSITVFRTDFFSDWLVWSPCSPGDSQESSPTPQFKSINFSAPSFLYSPTLTSIHDYWKSHSFD